MKKFLVISAIALTTFSAFCAGTKKFGKMKDSDWVVTNAWQAMQHHVKPDSGWATNHFGSAEFSNAVGKVQRKVDIPVKSVNGKTGDVILNAADVHALPDTYTPPPETDPTDPTVPAWAKQPNPPEGMTDNALVLTDDKVQTKGGDENLGEASLGTLHVSRIYNNDLRQSGPLYIVSPWMYAFVDKFIIGGTDQNPDGAYNVALDGSGISAYNGMSFFGFPQGRSGIIALENWQSLSEMLRLTSSTDLAEDQTFSSAVLAVGLNIDTNSVAVLNEIADTFGGFPIEGTATTVGGLLAALAAAIAWLRKSKVGSFESVGGANATVDNGVAKLSEFFTESNSLLAGTIDGRLPIPISAKSAGFTTESYKRFVVTVSGDMTVTLHTPTSEDAEIFECRFNGASLSADASITFAGATATTMDANCGTVTAGKVALMSAFWNGMTWDVNWKVEG